MLVLILVNNKSLKHQLLTLKIHNKKTLRWKKKFLNLSQIISRRRKLISLNMKNINLLLPKSKNQLFLNMKRSKMKEMNITKTETLIKLWSATIKLLNYVQLKFFITIIRLQFTLNRKTMMQLMKLLKLLWKLPKNMVLRTSKKLLRFMLEKLLFLPSKKNMAILWSGTKNLSSKIWTLRLSSKWSKLKK